MAAKKTAKDKAAEVAEQPAEEPRNPMNAAPVSGDIDERMAALLADHRRMGARK